MPSGGEKSEPGGYQQGQRHAEPAKALQAVEMEGESHQF
ncbi:hypothetical protein MARINOS108_10644 [Marinoscillum sp. 108]|nr:hypothetical protein MARINOS108_10644 [Marinoscillum sp. 108]